MVQVRFHRAFGDAECRRRVRRRAIEVVAEHDTFALPAGSARTARASSRRASASANVTSAATASGTACNEVFRAVRRRRKPLRARFTTPRRTYGNGSPGSRRRSNAAQVRGEGFLYDLLGAFPVVEQEASRSDERAVVGPVHGRERMIGPARPDPRHPHPLLRLHHADRDVPRPGSVASPVNLRDLHHRPGGSSHASSVVSPALGRVAPGRSGTRWPAAAITEADPAAEGECDERADGARGERRRELAAEPRRDVADAARDDEHDRRDEDDRCAHAGTVARRRV